MSGNTTLFTRESHPSMYLPEDAFPKAPKFVARGLKNTLRDFLKVLREHPAYAETVHEAFYRLTYREGTNTERTEAVQRNTGKEIPSFLACSKFFGVEEAFYDILIGYGAQAAKGGRARRKALAITGSPGAGKSDLVNHIQLNIMRKREPIPFLGSSVMWNNPLDALYLARLIADRKTDGDRTEMVSELVKIIEGLDLTGTAAVDFDNKEVADIAAKHGFDRGQKLSSAELATICLGSDEDFVKLVAYGLGCSKATVDGIVRPDPFAQDVVLGEYFGTTLIKNRIVKKADIKTVSGKPAHESKAKKKGDPNYGDFDADLAVELGDFPLDNMFMSQGQGMVDVSEVQPINFDLKVWRGDTAIESIGMYADSDPRCVNLSGVFNKGKLIILTEGFRNPPEGFRVLLEALEGQRIPLPEPLAAYYQQGVGWEGMVIIHSNDEQWNKFYSNPDHRAHNDRLSWTSWKYPVEPTQAANVTRKLWTASAFGKSQKLGGVHLEPLVFDYTGFFRVASHLDWESKRNLPFLAVLRAYNGQTLRQPGMGTELDVRSLREQAPWAEGLDGMSPREMDDILGKLAANAQREFESGQRPAACVTVAEVRDFMIERFSKDPRIDKKTKEKWMGWLQLPLEKDFRRFELSKVYKAAFIPNFAELCQVFFTRYQDFLKGIQPGRGSSRPGMSGSTYVNTQQMESFLQEIERADTLAINSAQADKFRLNVQLAIDIYKGEYGTAPPYTVHEGLKRCIEAYVLRQAKDITGIVGLTNVSEEERKRIEGAKSRLILEHGYCEHCAGKLLVEVAMTRDFLVA